MTDDIFFATIPDLNARLKKREFSAVELTKAFADRLEKLGPALQRPRSAAHEIRGETGQRR